ncbi:MAG: hypothetical protein IJ722_03875 [Alloprevotella sp.]|nr:hypothetical protein [Alloprevotella sp.]
MTSKIRMTRNTLLLPLLAVATLFAACSGDEPLVRTNGESPEGTKQPLAHLASGPAPTVESGLPSLPGFPAMPGLPGLKTYLHSEGNFCWNTGDNVFVNVDGTFIAPYKNTIAGRQDRADFYMDRYLTGNQYQVVYTGNGNGSPNEVTIPASQPFTGFNNSESVQWRGDCGSAWAVLNAADNCYYFDIDHKASYLFLVPTTMEEPVTDLEDCVLEKIVIKSNNTLTGTFPFSFDGGLDVAGGTATGTEVTVDCHFPLDEKIDTLLTAYGGNPKDGVYVVIAPGNHNLTIEYYVRYFALQSQWWNPSILMWEYAYDTGDDWLLPEGEYIGEGMYKFTRTVERNFAPNDHKRINHKLSLVRPDFVYNFQNYYQWDAATEFWTGWDWHETLDAGTVTDFPRQNQDSILVRFDDAFGTSAFHNWVNRDGTYPSYGKMETTMDMSNAADASRTAATMPNANEITWWMQYGKPHRDNATVWWMRDYRAMPTLCKSGVWFLKRSKMVDNNGNPVTPDPTRAAPMFEQCFNALDADLKYDLRQGSPSSNLRRYYAQSYNHGGLYPRTDPSLSDEWGYDAMRKPDDTEDYFFLPSFGYYTLRDPLGEDVYAPSESPYNTSAEGSPSYEFPTDYLNAQLKLVGVRGHYWSSTPWRRLMPNAALEVDYRGYHPPFYVNCAYYLYCNEDYVALSWYGTGRPNERRSGYMANKREDGTSWFVE